MIYKLSQLPGGPRRMHRYDPLEAPDPGDWLALREQARIDLALDYHRRANISLPNPTLHATVHAIVELQIALGDPIPAHRTALRLMDEGLDRHEAIHAIGSLLTKFMLDLTDAPESADPNAPYYAALEELTAQHWRRSR